MYDVIDLLEVDAEQNDDWLLQEGWMIHDNRLQNLGREWFAGGGSGTGW